MHPVARHPIRQRLRDWLIARAMAPINIGGDTVDSITIDGQDVQEVTVDGDTVYQQSDIPDSGLMHHYDASDDSSITQSGGDVTGWDDKVGAWNLSNNTTGLTTINGTQAVEFKSDTDKLDYDASSGLTQPFDIYAVAEPENLAPSGRSRIYDGFSQFSAFDNGFSDTNLEVYHGTNLTASSEQTSNPVILAVQIDGNNSAIRKNGTQVVSGDAGTIDLDGITVGNRREVAGGDHQLGALGELRIYDPTMAAYSQSDVESYLSDKWGIAI